jgi:hypothetical protein
VFDEELVLVLVDGLDELRSDIRVGSGTILQPLVERHEDLDGQAADDSKKRAAKR